MAKCKRCGKWGLFLKLNSFGQCEKCEKELAEAARLERERKKAAFWEELNNLTHAEIRRDGVKQKAQPVSYLKEAMTYPRVTAKSNAAKFADFVVLDTETTGLSCTKDAVLEVAAIKVKSFKFVEVFHTMITPPRRNFRWIPRLRLCPSMA